VPPGTLPGSIKDWDRSEFSVWVVPGFRLRLFSLAVVFNLARLPADGDMSNRLKKIWKWRARLKNSALLAKSETLLADHARPVPVWSLGPGVRVANWRWPIDSNLLPR